MKRIKRTAFIIGILLLCLALCSCGATEQSDERLKARLRGSGSAKLKLTIFSEVPEGYGWAASMPETADGAPYTVELDNSKPGTDRFVITANREGTSTLTVSYRNKDGEVYGSVKMLLITDSKRKMECASMLVSGRDDFKQYEDENLSGDDFAISNYESRVKDIKLISKDGIWKIGAYDASVIHPEDTGLEDDYSTFQVSGLKTGVSDLVLYNENAGLQVIISFAVTEDTEAQKASGSGEPVYKVDIAGTKTEPYQKTEDTEYQQGRGDALEKIRAFAADPIISKDAVFDDSRLHVEEKSLELQLEYKGFLMFCNATKGKSLNSCIKDYMNGIGVKSEKTITAAGLDVQCKFAEDGFAVAFLEKDDIVWMLLGAGEFTEDSFTALITEFIESK